MFALVFGLFVLAMVVLCGFILWWAVRHDLDARKRSRDTVSQPGDEMDR